MHLNLHNTSCLPPAAALPWPLILLQPPLGQRHRSDFPLSLNNPPKQNPNVTPKTIQQNTRTASWTNLLSNTRAAGKVSVNFGLVEFLGSSKRSISWVCEGIAASAQFCCSGPWKLTGSQVKMLAMPLYPAVLWTWEKRMLFPKHLLLSIERNPTFLAISQDFPNFNS